MKVTAVLSMWDLGMEKGNAELEKFQKAHHLISDQLFSDFVSEMFAPFLLRRLCRLLHLEQI